MGIFYGGKWSLKIACFSWETRQQGSLSSIYQADVQSVIRKHHFRSPNGDLPTSVWWQCNTTTKHSNFSMTNGRPMVEYGGRPWNFTMEFDHFISLPYIEKGGWGPPDLASRPSPIVRTARKRPYSGDKWWQCVGGKKYGGNLNHLNPKYKGPMIGIIGVEVYDGSTSDWIQNPSLRWGSNSSKMTQWNIATIFFGRTSQEAQEACHCWAERDNIRPQGPRGAVEHVGDMEHKVIFLRTGNPISLLLKHA